MASAYRNSDGSVAVVTVNYSESERELLLNLENMNTRPVNRNAYTTSEETSLEKKESGDLGKAKIPKLSSGMAIY